MSEPKVSLITLTYNRKDLIENLDKSLIKNCKSTPYEWLVMDNGDDETLCGFSGINFIKHDNSGNFATMNNQLAKYALGDILIFLNNDMVAKSDFIYDMSLVLDKNPDIGIVGACLYYPSEKLQHSGVMIQDNIFPANMGEQAIATLKLNEVKCRPHHWRSLHAFQAVTGACMAIRTADFLALGGFHEEFNWNFEDVDLCFRMQLHLQKNCVVSPMSVLTHLESETDGTERNVEFNLGLLQGRWRGIVKSDHRFFMNETNS